MQSLSEATGIIRHAEHELRQLLLRAAEQGDYESVHLLAEWAKQLSQMAQQDGLTRDAVSSGASANGKPHADSVAMAGSTIQAREREATGKARRTRTVKKKKAAKAVYPKFLRDGEELLKIGWSKREKKVYRHKAPKQVVFLVSQALQRAGQQGDRFAMDQILPIHDPDSNADVPAYQTYLSLAWLRKEELIVQHGRQGYSLLPETNLTDAVEERWKLLPKS